MPQQVPLSPGDPVQVGQYRLRGRIEGIPSEDPIFLGLGPDGAGVTISMLRGEWSHDAAARDRFAAEATVARRVPPFCAARVLDAGADGSGAYLVSEYIPGLSLLELVLDGGPEHGPGLMSLAIGMATGLASIHLAGLVHGNFGPEYVILGPDGQPRVVEFGITPPYGSATPSADMLAWAQTVAFAATGQPPESLTDLSGLPDALHATVAECLQPDASARPAARAVVRTLLGTDDLPAGLLAEGSRRAAALATRDRGAASRDGGFAAGLAARHSAEAGDQHAGRRAAVTGPPPRRRAGWLAAVTVIVAAVVVAGVLYLVNGSGGRPPSTADRLSAHTGPVSTTTSPGPSPSPSPLPTPSRRPPVPKGFAGTWSGLVRQVPSDTYDVSVTFTAGATSGTVSYAGASFSCSGRLSLVTATTSQLTLSQAITQGKANCGDGMVTLTTAGTAAISFSFRSNGPTASGTLDHS